MLFEDLDSYHQNIELMVEVNASKFLDTELIRQKRSILTQVFSKPNKFLYTGVPKFPSDINARLSLEIFIESNELSPVWIKKYGELEENIELLVFHQILLMKLSTIKKKRQKKLLYVNGHLKKEKSALLRFHTHLQTRNSARQLSMKKKIMLMLKLK